MGPELFHADGQTEIRAVMTKIYSRLSQFCEKLPDVNKHMDELCFGWGIIFSWTFAEGEWDGVEGTDLARDKHKLLALLKNVMNLMFP